MIQPHIISYFGDELNNISTQIRLAGMSKSPETVHDLRVSIKKIRSFVKMFKPKERKRKIRRFLKNDIGNIYKKAGKLRDLQLQLGLVKDYEEILKKEFFDLKESLTQIIKIRQKKFKDTLPDDPVIFCIPFLSDITYEIESMEDEGIKKSISHYFSKRIRKFNKTKVRFYPHKLHNQRKILKEIRFTSEMMKNLSHETDFEEQINNMKKFEDILGSWNDYNLLKSTIVNHLRKLKKPDSKYVIKMNVLSEAVSSDIVILLDNYHKMINALKIEPVSLL